MEMWELETKWLTGIVAAVACMLSSSTEDFLMLYWAIYVYMFIYLFGEPGIPVFFILLFLQRALVNMFLNNAVNIYITMVCVK